MAKKPIAASLRPLRQMTHLETDTGAYDVDPAADPMGYTRLLIDSANRRNREDQTHDDTVNAAQGPLGVKGSLMGQFSRMQGDAARQGFAAPWQPFLESLNVIGDNAGGPVKTDTRSLQVPLAPQPGLPPGYTDDRYASELDTFARGGHAPAFADSDTSGFPEIGRRFQTEMSRRLTPSMRALAKQGGY